MNPYRFHCVIGPLLTAAVLACAPSLLKAQSFSSGSTGADGPFNPTSSVTLTMPASGVFNFTTVNVPVNVTVTFKKNAANTPVVILATGNVVVGGVVDVSGQGAPSTSGGQQPAVNFGIGGPGGFNGGGGGNPQTARLGSAGQGPGGGFGGDGVPTACSGWAQGGGGGGYGEVGNPGRCNSGSGTVTSGAGGVAYGSALLQPLIGGSGGGGGAGGTSTGFGSGGGGGGGAILIASSTAISFTGNIISNGGNSGDSVNCCSPLASSPSPGGGGSGGSIRLVAPAVSGTGQLRVSGGGSNYPSTGGNGAVGRTRIDIISTGTLGYFESLASLAITSVGGLPAPALPTGAGDISFPAGAGSTQAVALSTTGVPTGTTVTLTVKPQNGAPTTSTSTPLTGTRASATATASIEVPLGVSTVTATTSYTVTVAMGDALSVYAANERVERIVLTSEMGGTSKSKLITVSGKQFDAPSQALALVHAGS